MRCRWTYVLVHAAFPPFAHYVVASFQRLSRFLDEVEEEAELAGDEVGVVGVAGPGADVDDVEGLVQQVADQGQLGEDEGWGCGLRGEVDGVGGGGGGGVRGADGGQGREADLDVLRHGVLVVAL